MVVNNYLYLLENNNVVFIIITTLINKVYFIEDNSYI